MQTLKQAAETLGVTPDALRMAIMRGALNATKLGRDWFVTELEIERYRQSRQNRKTCQE